MRAKLAIALTFPVLPALGGGQVRVLHLYRELARLYDIEIVSLTDAEAGNEVRVIDLGAGIREIRVPKSREHAAAELALASSAGELVTDVAMGRLHALTPAYGDALAAACDGADAVIASHPYAYPVIREVAAGLPLCYEAHNVEYALKEQLLGGTETGRSLLEDVDAAERGCCEQAALIWTCSEADRAELIRRYGADGALTVVVPNAVAVDEIVFRGARARAGLRRALRIDDHPTAVFLASWHPPNVAAAERVVELARRRPRTEFLVLGSVGTALAGRQLPANLSLTGAVPGPAKDAILGVADAALNPVVSGSGTNIKMLDYFAGGVPVVATAFGARGLGVEDGRHYIEAEPSRFDTALDRLVAMSADEREALVAAARAHVERTLSWAAVAAELEQALEGVLGAAHADG